MNVRVLLALSMLMIGTCMAYEDKTEFKDVITGLSREDFINKVMKYEYLHERFRQDCVPMSSDKDKATDTICAQLVDQIFETYTQLYPERSKEAWIEEPFYKRAAAVGDILNNIQTPIAARGYYLRKTLGL
ncbi:MAG TPA: hypothetical protein VGW78_04705 [Candidatus Babeliales bacterium]|jgi:hypothetical protein|nr:hypothetical protein [Candidatus Babeliales bacterium]